MTQQHILILSIGPVQSFIAEARRTADLYVGSQILVKLARSIVEAINESEGKLIYPTSNNLKTADMPNKMVAIVNKPHEVAKAAQRAMLKQWLEFAKSAFKALKLGVILNLTDELEIEVSCNDQALQHIIKRQLNHHLEFYWVAAPLNGDYDKAYKKADRAFGARKQTRNFEQVIEDGFKDSLSGTRSALRRGQDKDARAYWKELRKSKRNTRQLQEGELLDTIGVIKRFCFDKSFPSTSTVASTSFIKNCPAEAKANFVQAIEEYNQQVKDGPKDYKFQDGIEIVRENDSYLREQGYFHQVPNFERGFNYGGDLLYLEGYERLEENYGDKPPVDISPLKDALKTLYKTANKLPSPYYAIVQMDGDSMGAHVSQCKTKDDHQQVSQILDKFTQAVDGLVNEHQGYRIYAGGDDVLAFFPADCALNAAQILAQKYRTLFEAWPHRHKTDEGKEFPFTASIGIVFAHYLDPLDLVLRTAHDAEKRAKNQYGRDAIAVTILRRSGQTLEVGGKWTDTVDMVKQLSELFEKEEISSRFPYNVLREAKVVTKLDQAGREAMLKLLLNRAIDTEKATFDKDGLLKIWLEWAKNHDKEETGINNNQGYVELARWFVVARWLSAGGQE